MREIRFALLSEGTSEKPLVDHLVTLCSREGFVADGEWPDLRRFAGGKDVVSQLRCLLELDDHFDLVFIHRDADARSDSHARSLVRAGMDTFAARVRGVPIVPIQEIEAWLLLDESAIRRAARNIKGREPLDLPKVGRVEDRANPKEALLDALVKAAKPGRDRSTIRDDFGRLRRELLENLDLDGPINSLTAWQNLLRDLRAALAELTHLGDTPIPADPLNPCPPSTRS